MWMEFTYRNFGGRMSADFYILIKPVVLLFSTSTTNISLHNKLSAISILKHNFKHSINLLLSSYISPI
jgi:hypothetical protein